MRSRAFPLLALLIAACGQAERKAEPPAIASPLQFERASADPVRHGERLSRVLGCQGCHGPELHGEPWSEEAEFAILFTSNLTRTVPLYTDAELARTIRFGTRPDGSELWEMPSHIFTDLSEPDMAALIAWLRSRPAAGPERPRIVMGPEGRREIAAGSFKSAARQAREGRNVAPLRLDGRHDRARYMIRATCGECHGLSIEGGPPPAPGAVARPDLIVAGAYSRDEFRRLLRTGEARGGRRLGLMAEVAQGRFAHLTDGEVDAIHEYLKARAEAPQ